MSESYRLERGRGGGQHLIGVQALVELLHVGQDEVYGLKKVKKVHAQMVAADIDEPTENNVVELLENLPWEEREYYQEEKNVITPSCVSESLFAELTERFAFVGGSEEEYAAYFARDLPDMMWDFCEANEVKTLAGFSVVPRKPRGVTERCCRESCS